RGHKCVLDIVAAGDEREDAADAAGFFLGADQLDTELNLVLHDEAPLAAETAVRHMRPQCLNFPKSKPQCAAWSRCATGAASPVSKRGEKICGGLSPKTLASGSPERGSPDYGGG